MKTRIVALILTVVMSLLALTSCGSFNFANEDLTAYADFNYDTFKAALSTLVIKDGDFTTDEATREKMVASKIYTTIADKIVTATTDEADRKTEGALGKGDVLYFVYYAVDEATGNVYFTSEMKEASITTSTASTDLTKDKHVIKLGDVNEKGELQLKLKEALGEVNVPELKDAIYSMVTAADLTSEELALKEGDTIVISYKRTSTTAEGEKIEETANFVKITLASDSEDELVKKFLEEGAVAKLGSNLTVKNGETNSESFTIGEYTYSDVKALWKVESEGQAIATFKYTPYTSDKKFSPDNLTKNDDSKQVNLKDVELTYYVYPVYAIAAPTVEEMTAVDILVYAFGSTLAETSFEAFKDETYVNGDKKIADLLKEAANVYNTSATENDYYKEGTELKTLLDAYNEAYKASSATGATTEQKETTTKAQNALSKAQRAEFKLVAEKIAACTNGTKTLGEVIIEEYEHDTHHSLKEAYDTDIAEKIQSAVWDLIQKSVTVKAYPEKLVKEYMDHLYESYEYNYYKGDYSSTVKNIDKYASLNEYLITTLKLTTKDTLVKEELNAALEKEAKAEIETIIKIYVVAKACQEDAAKVLPNYIEADIAGGAYHVSEKAYKDAYGDKADAKIEEAKKNAEENIASAREEATVLVITDAYMKDYKKEIGRAYYRDLCEQYGEINIRAAFQFNRLFYYLTCTDIQLNEDGTHTEVKYTEDGYLSFRTVKYTLEADK